MSVSMNVAVFVLGLCLGSFINVVIYRLPRDDVTISRPRRSACPHCGGSIAWHDNLPIVSYLFLKGKCRHCGHRISWRYPVVELLCGLLCLAVFFKTGLGLRTVAGFYFVLALVAITYIDLDHWIIPDVITFPGMVVGLAASFLAPDPGLIGVFLGAEFIAWGVSDLRFLSLIGSGLGLALGGLLPYGIMKLYAFLRKQEGMGGGDLTLLAMIGAFLGWRAVLMTLFFGSAAALVGAIFVAKRDGGFGLQMPVPFGPFLSLAALVNMFFGESILRWYLG
ncbi:MAG: prepilin peptidase [Pseudomonadota bacterium]